jgi:hypothetical protein
LKFFEHFGIIPKYPKFLRKQSKQSNSLVPKHHFCGWPTLLQAPFHQETSAQDSGKNMDRFRKWMDRGTGEFDGFRARVLQSLDSLFRDFLDSWIVFDHDA